MRLGWGGDFVSGQGTMLGDNWRTFGTRAKGKWEVYFETIRTQKLVQEKYTIVLGLSVMLTGTTLSLAESRMSEIHQKVQVL